ncbi:uncharacterized protein LOC109859959 isoform X2 [Pseudomyrmex gracilis]|uniref:uncharacterized protein LOC109859959 isoform X2 n=1 Tax=Pseudomyrmex gracilis TaxID=219809 RepID=UPI00099506BE|nr:uncharacterized protein LOC109859959 isoform X2 [Pseudomyrmex gracilis]
MHHQFHDDEEEFEPRITPKPIAKLDHFAVPTVPEVSLIFEKSPAQTSNKNSSNSLSVRSSENIAKHSSTTPVSYNSNSYATWRKQNYLGETNSTSTTYGSPSYKNAYNCSHVSHSNFQDVSIQAKQRQDKICDMQKELVNTRVNDRICEKSTQLKCSDIINSPNFEEDMSHFSNGHLSCNSRQKGPYGVPDYTKRLSNGGVSDALQKIEQLPCIGYQQFSTPSSNIDNNETVRTLLQLVNNQSEQIKTLQLQVDRLVRMQEETFRNKSACLCSQSLANQVFRCPTINHYDTAISSSIGQSQNQSMKKPMSLQSTSVIEKKVLDSFNKEDADKYEKKELENNMDRRNAINVHDTTEPVMRYKNTFTCRPVAAQLENIVEVAESNMSSSQQQSSNFNTSSVRDSERHISRQSDLYNMANASESSKMYQCHAPDLTKRKMPEEVYIGKSNTVDKEVENADRMMNASMNVNRSPAESANCSKALSNLPNYVAINKENSNNKMNAYENASQNYLPMTDYYQNYREREHNVKQSRDISDSMTLSEGDLRVVQRPPPTPEPSIHVEMQEYSSDDESDSVKRTPKIGWTLYNNVLGQVNEILQNSGAMDDKDENNVRSTSKNEQEYDREAKTAVNTVKVTTLEQLRKLGISLTENNEHKEANANKSLDYDSSFYPRLDCQANMIQTTSIVNETNTSMHMKALALKYLNDEQLADIALHKQESLKHLMVSNMQGTNLSFATMRYLERYQLIPGKNNIQMEDQIYGETASKHDFKLASEKDNPALRRRPLVQTSGTACPSRILDLSALKKQPKLL